MIDLNSAKSFIARKHLILYKVSPRQTETFLDRERHKNKFSFILNKEESDKFTKKSLVLIECDDECFLCKIRDKRNSTPDDKIIVLSDFQKMVIGNLSELVLIFSGRERQTIENKLENQMSILSELMSKKVIEFLWRDNAEKISNLIEKPKKSDIKRMEADAIKFAFSIANFDRSYSLEDLVIKNGYDTELKNLGNPVYEDDVISGDVHNSFEGIKCESLIGRAKYSNGVESLTLYVTNRKSLEKIMGIDFIYVNKIHQNIVMVQYKRLRQNKDNWAFDIDEHFKEQMNKMKATNRALSHCGENEFRLNSNPFYLRFIQSKETDDKVLSFILSHEHCEKLLNTESKFYFQMRDKNYIGKQELEGLIRSGYIGTYSADSEHLQKIIDLINSGETRNSLVLAFKEKINGNLDNI
ncbi:hypothetical protein [Lonepinella sp. BR2357]|uniref:hypothetical protein n=1 Tax=Lonepinella sp. BR2357 TaxID=3434549 RepID=UPI003F6E14B2